MVLVSTLGARDKVPVPMLTPAPLGLNVSVKKLTGPSAVVAIVVPPVRLIVGASTVIPAPGDVFVTLPPNVTAPPVEVSVVAWFIVTLSLYVWFPDVLTEPPVMAVVPPAFAVKPANGVVPPTEPPNVVVPAVFSVSACAPLRVLVKVMAWPPELVRVVVPVRVTASL